MFTRWAIGNFKSIREPVSLELGALTIFSGVNSSGKSTLIQSILMVAQSLASSRTEEGLLLNGRFLQLGRLADVCHYGQEKQPIYVGFDWSPAEGEMRYRLIRVEAWVGQGQRASFGRAAAEARPVVLRTALTAEENVPGRPGETRSHQMTIEAAAALRPSSRVAIEPALRRQMEEGHFNYIVTNQTSAPGRPAEQGNRVALTSLLPQRLLVVHDSALQRLIEDTEWLIGLLRRAADPRLPVPRGGTDRLLSPELPGLLDHLGPPEPRKQTPSGQLRPDVRRLDRLMATGRSSRNQVINELTGQNYHTDELREYALRLESGLRVYLKDRQRESGKEQLSYEERLLPSEYRAMVDELGRAARERVYYLGPLRDEPRVIYQPPPHSDQWSVGLKGEYAAAVLDSYANFTVYYPLPPGDGFEGEYQVGRGRLSEAVTVWLRRMGLVESVDTEETPKVGFRLTVNSPGLPMALDLKSVGVGVSQVLPTLVQALLAPAGSTLIFEQPELHLHPKAQAELADFFLGIAQVGKQCVVETHSEQLILRLRRRIAGARRNQVLPRLRIYFAERVGAATRFREVQPDEYGAIVEWPAGFFDQGDLESSMMLREQIRKSREAIQSGGKA